MPTTSFTTINCYKKEKALLFLLTITILPFTSSSIQINNQTEINFFELNSNNSSNQLQNKLLDFSHGTWLFIKNAKVLEFHSNTSGFLDLGESTDAFYKTLYLEAPKRVLVFPQKHLQNTARRPYIDSSRAWDSENDNVLQIFPPPSSEDQGTTLNESFNLQNVLDLVFPPDDRTQLLKDWNLIPFINPMIESTKYNPQWGKFKNFWKTMEKIMNDNEANIDFISEQETQIKQLKDYIFEQLMSRIIGFLYYEDVKQFMHFSMEKGDFLKAVKVYGRVGEDISFIENYASSIDGSEAIAKYKEDFFNLLHPLMKKMIDLYLSHDPALYFDTFFANNSRKNLEMMCSRRKMAQTEFPPQPTDWNFSDSVILYANSKIQEAASKDFTDEEELKQLNDELTQTKEKFSAFFIEMFGTLFPAIVEALEEDNQSDNEILIEDQINDYYPFLKQNYEEMTQNEDFEMKFESGNDEKLQERFNSISINDLLTDVLKLEGMNLIKRVYQLKTFEGPLSKWKGWKSLRKSPPMDIFDSNEEGKKITDLVWFREILVLLGETNYFRGRDDIFFETNGIEIFTDARILI